MKSVSNKFKAAIVAPSRMCKMKVTFDISDTTANGDITSIVTTPALSLSDKQQIVNKVRESSYKLATFEKDRWLLDGSFVIPAPEHGQNGEMGWWSNALCDAGSTFTTPEEITVVFSGTHSSMGLTISFDTLSNEYATEFDILAYDSSDIVISTLNITGNTQARFVIETQLYLYKKIAIRIKKWCKPYRRAKVTEIDFGVVRVYEDSNLIKATLIEEADITSSKLPPAELKFVVHNNNNEFNILNPSGFYKFLQQRQQVICELGADIGGGFEYCKMGTYWLRDWQSDEGSLTATFTARNIIDLLDNYEYENLAATSTNLKAVAINILTVAGIMDYILDDALESIATTGLIKKTKCRTALQMVALAGRCNVYVSDNTLVVESVDFTLTNKVGDIDMENMYKEPTIALDKLVRQVDVKYYTDINTGIVESSVNPGVSSGDLLKVDSNTLISSAAVAQAVGEWIIARQSLRAIYTANWRQNPSLDLYDTVDIDNAFETKKAVITKQEYEYQGYLSGKTELRGEITV